MNARVEDSAQEIKRLQRCLNDLVSLLALPAIWSSEPSEMVAVLLEALLRTVSLDFAWARLTDPVSETAIEILRPSDSRQLKPIPIEIGEVVSDWLKRREGNSQLPPTIQLGKENLLIFPVPLGVEGEIGMIVVASEREDFPNQIESLLLSVATNQASIGLREAALLRKQKRIAIELEQRVAERTATLAQTNEELRRSEGKWKSVFDNSAVGVVLTSLSGRFIAANSVFQEMVGYAEDELQQFTFFEITHEEDIGLNRSLLGELFEGKSQQFQIEKRFQSKDGDFVWARLNVCMVSVSEQAPRFLMALVEDITQRRQSEEALAKARSELARVANITSLGVLTASIAHEVNQPLSGIITNAGTCMRMLSADPPNLDGARETVRRTIRDGNRAADVISRLRKLYSKKEPSPEPMDLNEATREVTALSLTDIQRSGAVLRHDLADDLPPVIGDRVQLQQVILNLLRNGADAMSTIDDRPRELLVRTERHEESQVRLSVKDSGVGFTPQTAEKIFEAFYTTKTDGMGIGLSISRSIIEAHQGRIWAMPNDGPGATFSFAIPCNPIA
jgi:PAS domain S-box-containing protein